MRVLHICTRDSGGGAPTACQRLHRSLLENKVDSWILCDVPSNTVPNSVGIRKGNTRGRLVDRITAKMLKLTGALLRPPFLVEPMCHSNAVSTNFFPNRLISRIQNLQPDLVHLHWVGRGMLRIEDLPLLASQYPVVWTLHDMWPFCGAEHVAYDDSRWKFGYTKNNRNPAAKGPDWNRWVWNRKMKSWAGTEIHTIAVSRWMNQSIVKSRLFREISGIRCMIHNGLDENVFSPSQKPELVSHKKNGRPLRILFGAATQKDPTKGGSILLDALQFLQKKKHKIQLFTFGNGQLATPMGMHVKNCGSISNLQELAKLYATVDIVVTPSKLESFGQVAAESLACGTPVVCFDTSGLRDIVDHKVNGYRARCFEPKDLAEGIRWCLDSPERHGALRQRARETALHRFRIHDIAAKTIALYDKILSAK